ncbi:hypothetical protein TraAM80_08738 [Trypanosoma rangeli]|uniref:Uncharacterized protein n=1 Tax=Trypanosoma rangeli TaxID=5698 RepID=A0A3R7M9B9_TRYRA|nr:uncharacterized protein TraAM80_08738 [Trypanosoma rangeli]RNE98510.1 hypothetical protein TraAM80_08738 [Trypanosoma rangeli]|eukprot:RNE98510.1 hypothetical protein TraAM80_08738 [Trypanosoma rangeli]
MPAGSMLPSSRHALFYLVILFIALLWSREPATPITRHIGKKKCNKNKGIMGCTSTKEKRSGGFRGGDESGGAGAGEFSSLAKENPVAATLKEEWSDFVRSLSVSAFSEARREVWANTASSPLTHRSVDKVGKLFLVYVRNDLTLREWGGNFDYTVVGLANQGFLRATATVDAGGGTGQSKEAVWEVKVHYHSTTKPQ